MSIVSDFECGSIWVMQEEAMISVVIITDSGKNEYLHMDGHLGGLFPTSTDNLAQRLCGYKKVDSLESIIKLGFEERPKPNFGMNPCSEVFLNGKAPF